MHLRPYQNAPVEWLSQKAKALLVAPAGSGKTRMALVALQRFSAPEASILWLAHTREQIQQAQRAAYDVCPELNISYVCYAGLDTDVRRSHERELVARWAEGLGGYNVSMSFDEAWLEYRRFTFAGFMMAVIASMIVKQTERGDDMFMAMANRHAQHVADLDALAVVRG